MKKYIYIIFLLAAASCSKDSNTASTTTGTASTTAPSSTTSTGRGGSYARFAVNNDYLYALCRDTLKVFSIDNGNELKYQNTVPIGRNVETMLIYNGYMFFGTSSGMAIYDLANKKTPEFKSFYTHIYSCDPVAVDGNYAYLTLHDGEVRGRRFCTRTNVNRMEVINISDVNNISSTPVAEITMTQPLGIGAYNKRVIVCTGGLKMYNATNPVSLKEMAFIPNIDTGTNQRHFYDVIMLEKTALTIGENGFYQYDYLTNNTLTLLSHIPVVK